MTGTKVTFRPVSSFRPDSQDTVREAVPAQGGGQKAVADQPLDGTSRRALVLPEVETYLSHLLKCPDHRLIGFALPVQSARRMFCCALPVGALRAGVTSPRWTTTQAVIESKVSGSVPSSTDSKSNANISPDGKSRVFGRWRRAG
jgi:hypothetical protein